MKKQSFALLALALALASSPAAWADSFDFTFTDISGVSGSGTLTGTYEGLGNPWLITGGSATFNDGVDSGAVSLIANPSGPGGSTQVAGIGYDDLLDPFQVQGTYLDSDGLLFQFGNGDYLNIYFDHSVGGGPNYYGWDDSLGNGDDAIGFTTGSFSITSYDLPPSEIPTPEPGGFLLLGSGLCALAGLVLRNRQQAGMLLNL
jgi:hypothetical protein